MKIYARFSVDGDPQGFWSTALFPDGADGERHSSVPAEAIEIPFEHWKELVEFPGIRRRVGGEVVEYSPPPIIEPPAPLALCQVAAARLVIDGFDITGIERSEKIGFAMMLDEATAWLFFAEPQPDTSYIVTPGDGVTKTTDYIEVSCPGVVNLNLIVQRVQ